MAGYQGGVCAVLSKTGLYDIRYLGGLTAAFVLFAAWSIIKTARSYSPAARIAVISVLLVLLTDPFYVQYYNSFFTEQSFFCYGLIFVAAFLRNCRTRSKSSLFIEITALSLLIFSKTQNVVVIIPGLAAIILQQYILNSWKQQKREVLFAAWLIVMECTILGSIKSHQPDHPDIPVLDPQIATYNVVMGRLLRVSDDPVRHLTQMGFDSVKVEKIKGNIGNSAYVNTFSSDNLGIYKKLRSIHNELRMIGREPSLVFKSLKDIQNSLYRDVDYLANFQSAELAHRKTSLLSFHNGILSKALPRNYVCLFGVMLTGMLISLIWAFRYRDPRLLIIAMLSSSVILMYTAVALGDGWENEKHLHAVNLLSGIVHIYVLLLFCWAGVRWLKRRLKRSAVNSRL